MRIPTPARLGAVSALVLLTAVLVAPLPFRLEPNASIAPAELGEALVALRRSFEGEDRGELPDSLSALAGDRVPLVLTAWVDGGRAAVWQVEDLPLSEAVPKLAAELRAFGDELESGRLRLQLTAATAEGWLPEDGLLFSLSFVEGHDGVSGMVGERRVYLPPSELVRQRKYGTFKPLPGYDSGFGVGVSRERVTSTIEHQAERLEIAGGSDPADLRRFRGLCMVEDDDLEPRRLLKGTLETAPLTRERGEAVVLAGARYLHSALKPSGKFRYYFNPVMDTDLSWRYNWPRHAGVCYSLALVGRLLERPELVETAGRALEGFTERLIDGPDGSSCLLAKGRCYLGSSALGLLALSEYRLASGDDRFDPVARRLAAFIENMQKSDGLFFHEWYPDKGIERELMKLYASQQAILALAIHARAVGDDGKLDAAERGMDRLAGPYWDHFLGSWFFGQEHWTCLAAEELYRVKPKKAYAELCHAIGTHYDNITHRKDETPFSEDAGGMSITHLFTPHVGGTATAAEAMVSAVRLGREIDRDVAPIEDQLRDTYDYLAKSQISVHDTFWMRSPRKAIGGFFDTQSKTRIRIDTVQHAISAVVRGLDLLPADDRPNALKLAARDFALPRSFTEK